MPCGLSIIKEEWKSGGWEEGKRGIVGEEKSMEKIFLLPSSFSLLN